MFIKRSAPKIEEVTISKVGSKVKCSICGKFFIPVCIDGVCETICSACKSKSQSESK